MPELNIFVDWADVVVSYSIYQVIRFEYNHLLVQTTWQCDTHNDIKITAYYNDTPPALPISGLTGYIIGDD